MCRHNNHKADYKTTEERNNKKSPLTIALIIKHLTVLFHSI